MPAEFFAAINEAAQQPKFGEGDRLASEDQLRTSRGSLT
jgi:hypothetical protein